jgi:hypothetical protein
MGPHVMLTHGIDPIYAFICSCVCLHVITLEPANSFHETWCDTDAFKTNLVFVILNFIQSVTPRWRLFELMRWGDPVNIIRRK